MERNLPATQSDAPPADQADQADQADADAADRLAHLPRQPLSVAFLPLALVTFIVLAFTIAAWTFLSTSL